MTSTRVPQLALRLDTATPDPAAQWRDGACIAYLGREIRLRVDAAEGPARLDNDVLHLHLPPQPTARQIQDAAETWLREAAMRLLGELVAQKSAVAGRRPPRLALSFAVRGHWAVARDAETLRCNWRLIEQPVAIIEQVVGKAVAALPSGERELDLFSGALAG